MDYNKIDYSRYYMRNKATYSEDREDRHEVEYITKEDPKPTKRRKNKGVKKKHKHGILGTILTLSIIVVTFAIIILIADSVRGGYVMSEVIKAMSQGKDVVASYYAVETRTFEDIESARVYANGVRDGQGAGYVINDDGYRVLVEVYKDESEAEGVAKRLKLDGESARVYRFDIMRIDYLKFPENCRNATKSAIEFNDRIYTNLYAIGLDLAKGNIDENSASMRVRGIKSETHNIIEEYIANVDRESSDKYILKVKAELTAIEAMLDNLSKNTIKRPNLLSDIRYTSCLIANAYRELSRELQ